MAEAYEYRSEDVTDANGNVVDTARFRIQRGGDWTDAEFRGTSRGGRVRWGARTAYGRGVARNPAMRTNR